MSRKYDRTLQVNRKVMEILDDPGTIHYIARKIIRPRPRFFPKILWRLLLSIVMAPETRKAPDHE